MRRRHDGAAACGMAAPEHSWGDKSGPEEDSGLTDQAFEKEVAGSVCKVITAKAVQSVLTQLGETDLVVAQWLNNFAAETSPLLGDEFILKMMRETPQTVVNPSSGAEHMINPQQLGNRVILTRAELGKTVSGLVPSQMEKRNITLLRKHLTDTSYISGSSEPANCHPRLVKVETPFTANTIEDALMLLWCSNDHSRLGAICMTTP
eukprot:jgi/Ulvmu1/11039/UM007_0220.1